MHFENFCERRRSTVVRFGPLGKRNNNYCVLCASRASAIMSRSVVDDTIFIKILPEHLSFGCISQGYVYQLTVTVINKSSNPQSLKVGITPGKGELNRLKSNFVPTKIAPGTKQLFTLDLSADSPGGASFTLSIEQSVNRATVTRRVSALVVPLDVFKHVAKSLTLQKRPIYRNGVNVIGALGDADASRSIVSASGASVLSEAMMDENDMADLMDLPLVDGLYFDHTTMELKVDSKLCQVSVGDYDVDKSIENTLNERSSRLDYLEDKGFHTMRSVASTIAAESGRASPSKTAGVRESPSVDMLDAGSSILGSVTPAVGAVEGA